MDIEKLSPKSENWKWDIRTRPKFVFEIFKFANILIKHGSGLNIEILKNDGFNHNGLTKWLLLKKKLTIGFLSRMVKDVVKFVAEPCNTA